MNGLQSYILSKKYTEQSLNGVGSLKGAPCTIKSTTETSEGTEVVFEWTGTDGTTETKTITIKNGVSITDIEINSNNHLICTMSDGSTIDAGEVPNVKGDTGFSPTIEENPNNTDEIYKLDITNESGTFTTPNLKGTGGGGLDPDRYYDKTQVDALIEPLDKAKHTHENKENVLDKLTTNTTGDTLLFNGQEIKGSVEIDDTTTTAEDKAWSAKKTNDTIDEVKQSVTEVDNKFADYDTSTEVDNKITNALADYSTTTEIDTKLTDYAKTADVDTKLADYYKKTETYSNTEIDDKFTDFGTNLTDDIKVWVNSEESLAIKTALYNNNTLMFYKKPNATVDDIADFSINLPEEQFLDQTKTTFINNFVWSEELYPNSTNPNLDNEPVLVLAVKGDADVVYSFVSMNELVKIYKASTTVSTVTLTIDDATNTISAEVNISADEGNLLKIGTDGGLYAKATVDNALSDTSENPVQNKVINVALNSKANASDLSDHTNNADIHVTAEEKTSWNNKAELTDIPTSLPADGGNADTLDGLHASDIQIDSVSDTAGIVTLDGLQGGVPFSDITVSGKNLLPYPYRSKSGIVNGVTFTVNDDRSVTVSGTATENANFYLSYDKQLNFPTGKYTMSGCPTGGSLSTYRMEAYAYDDSNAYIYTAKDIGSGMTLDLTDNLHFGIRLSVFAGTVVDTLTFKPQLERGEAATEYERPIIGQDVTLTACGKNLADLSVLDGKLMNGISFAYDNGNVVLNGTATAQIYAGIKIHLSADTYTVSGGTDKNARVVLRNKSWLNIADAIAGATVTVVSDDYYVHIAISSGTVCDNVVIKPQLERGAVATEYEPYSGSVTTITPDSNPYTVPNNIRQQDGLNNISVSAGEVSVTGVKRNAAVKKIWDNKADLSDIQIDTVSDTAGIVALDGLQGGVPFSEITLSGDIIGQEITLRAGGENLLTFSSHNETETISGVTFVRLPDGTITANGTATDIVQYLSDTVGMSDGNTYTLTGCPAGGSGEGYSITNQATANITDMGSGKTFTYDAATFGVARFKIRIAAGYTCDNVVFRPVLCSGAAIITKITPNSVPYIITEDIRQRDGTNTVSVSAGNVTVTGVRESRAVKRIWAKLDELTAAIIVSNGETTE